VARRVTATAVLLTAVASTAVAADGPAPIGWTPDEPYFRVGGRQAFVFGRNPTGWRVEQFGPLLQWAGESGERIVRIHLTSGMAPKGPAGAVDEAWAAKWERVFDQAAERGVYVLPVFSAWARWNDGSGGAPVALLESQPVQHAARRAGAKPVRPAGRHADAPVVAGVDGHAGPAVAGSAEYRGVGGVLGTGPGDRRHGGSGRAVHAAGGGGGASG